MGGSFCSALIVQGPRTSSPPYLFGAVVLAVWPYVSLGMMDIGHYATEDPPKGVEFADPGVAPPSFIFSVGQLRPPYDLNVETMEPFRGCTADYATLCAAQHAIRLVTRTREGSCSAIGAGGAARSDMLAGITAGMYEVSGAKGFGVAVFAENGEILADQLRPDLVGQRIDGVLSSSFVPQSSFLDRVAWVARYGGGFVSHLSTRLSEAADLNVWDGDAPTRVVSYVEPCPTGERIAVSFGRTPLPGVDRCSPDSNSVCAVQNLRRLTGRTLVEALLVEDAQDLSDLLYSVSYSDEYRVAEFYAYVFEASWWGYPGDNPGRNPSPLPDTDSTCLAHGGSPHKLNGRNLTEYSGEVAGKGLTYKLENAAWTGGAWRDYPWNTAELGDHEKVSLAAGVVFNETAFLVASGTMHAPEAVQPGPMCEVCSSGLSLSCNVVNIHSLALHARMEMLTPSSVWSTLTSDSWFGGTGSSEDGDHAGFWPEGFYVKAFDMNGTCIANGEHPHTVGMNFTDIFNVSYDFHTGFLNSAAKGGGWTSLVYGDRPYYPGYLTYILEVQKDQRTSYLFAATWKDWAPLRTPCSASYTSSCSNNNAQVVVGAATADILVSLNESKLHEALEDIAFRNGPYAAAAEQGFYAYVYNASWQCPPRLLETFGKSACPPALSPTSKIKLASLHASADLGWVRLQNAFVSTEGVNDSSVVRPEAPAHAYMTHLSWKAFGSLDEEDIFVLSVVSTAAASESCTSSSAECPANSECSTSLSRCVCKTGFLPNVTVTTSDCGGWVSTTMHCVEVTGMDCQDSSGAIDLDACTPCQAGYFCAAGYRYVCPAGQFCPAGSSSPQPCPAGSISASTGHAECEACSPGTVAGEAAATTCTPCAAGSSASLYGQTSCELCPSGTYSNSSGQDSCQSCPGGVLTESSGSVTFSDCRLCSSGYAFDEEDARCLECGWGYTTHSSTDTACSLREEAISGMVVFAFVVLCASTVSLIFKRKYQRYFKQLQAKEDAALSALVESGVSTIDDFGHPMVLMNAHRFTQLTREELDGMHEGNRDAHRLRFVDSFARFQELHLSGFRVIFVSYQWLSWEKKGPSCSQWDYMRQGVSEVIKANGWAENSVFVWLDILSIPQEHRLVQQLAVDSLYVYAKCADALLVVCPSATHEATGEPADISTYKRRIWCRTEVLARCCSRGAEQVYIVNEDGFAMAPMDLAKEMVKVFDGEMTCCRKGHENGTVPCDRETLVLPLLGLYHEGITNTNMSSKGLEFFRGNIFECKDCIFPSHYDYRVGTDGRCVRKSLFGDLLARIDRAALAEYSEPRFTTCSEVPEEEADSQGVLATV